MKLKKRGAVIGMSGGIDSSVVAALCVKALGKGRVLGVALPEKDSSPDSLDLAQNLAESLGIELIVDDISSGLEGIGAYQRRDEAIQAVFPAYKPGCKFKITLQSNPLERTMLNIFNGTVVTEDGEEYCKRLPLKEYLQIVAASNIKQRMRMTTLYYHAERRNYAVAGTGNKNEHDLGFFVKYGDGGSDFNPIVQLFKTRVFQLAKVLEIPKEIVNRTPTTDTYPGEVTQEEFFYRLPFDVMDFIWEQHEQGESLNNIAETMEMEAEKVQHVLNDIRQKQQSTKYLRYQPLTLAKNI